MDGESPSSRLATQKAGRRSDQLLRPASYVHPPDGSDQLWILTPWYRSTPDDGWRWR